jgi:hypothetical protein
MPSDLEMADYAQRLPPIYRAIMAAFPAIDPGRNAGYGLAIQTLAMHFANTRSGYSFGEVQEACLQLEHRGFIEIKNGIFAHPTELGEQLIAVVTNRPRASGPGVPQLPTPTW